MNKRIKKCRICGSTELISIAKFGNQYLTNFPKEINKKLPKCQLNLVLCDECKLLQLEHSANFDYLYKEYWYVSGVNQTMKNDLTELANTAADVAGLKEGDLVVDIGSNDSTLLKGYKTTGITRVGFEPAQNLIEMARGLGLTIINNYFNYADYEKIYENKKAKIITAAAMFYDLDDPNIFVWDMTRMLDDDGMIVIQLNYLPIMLETNAFDNVSHEHLEYYCLGTLKNLFDKHDLDIFDVSFNGVNGGSIRVYLCKKGKRDIKPAVNETLEKEEVALLHTQRPYKKFAKESKKTIKKINSFIEKANKEGKSVYVYGASTRGNALLQACGLDYKDIKAAADRNPMKHGHYMVGSWIPIISEEQARQEKPDYFLVLPWQFREEFIKRENEFLKAGGKFIFIFPNFEIYGEGKINL